MTSTTPSHSTPDSPDGYKIGDYCVAARTLCLADPERATPSNEAVSAEVERMIAERMERLRTQ